MDTGLPSTPEKGKREEAAEGVASPPLAPEDLNSLSRKLSESVHAKSMRGAVTKELERKAPGANEIAMESPIQIPAFYTWEAVGKSVSVHLDYDFIDRISMEIMRGFSLVPKRGAEVGGLLLGTVEIGEQVVIRVEDYEAVPCEYLRGPSYLLSPNDEERFAATVQRYEQSQDKRLYVVGLFRSHTRDTELALADEDVAVFRKFANDPANIFLLVRPYATKASVGAIFFEEDGELGRGPSYKEFPFRRRELGGMPVVRNEETGEATGEATDLRSWSQRIQESRERQDKQQSQSGEDDVPPQPILPAPVPLADSPSQKFRRKWILIPLSFFFLLLGLVLGFQAALFLNNGQQDELAFQSLGFNLEAFADKDGILLRWDSRAPAIRFGQRATLTIADGEFEKSVPVDAVQLQAGTARYRSTGSGVKFRLEVQTQRGSFVSQTVTYERKP
jgi:hypothetical protein